MSTLLEEILKWPVIVQGALGSALFWLVLVTGERATRKVGATWAVISKKRRIERLKVEVIRYKALTKDASDAQTAMAFVALLYGCMHELVRALAMICMGLIMDSVLPIFGIVGYVMALNYLLRAASLVRDTSDDLTPEEMVKVLQAQLDDLESPRKTTAAE